MEKTDLRILTNKLIKELKNIGIPVSSNIDDIVINSRAKARFGACKARRTVTGRSFTIEISSEILDCDVKSISEILIHELLHTCPECFNHGKKWKLYAAIVEHKLGYKIKTTRKYENFGIVKPDPKEEIRYVIKCSGCGAEFYRKRMCKLVKNPERYRCGKCGKILYLQGEMHNIL